MYVWCRIWNCHQIPSFAFLCPPFRTPCTISPLNLPSPCTCRSTSPRPQRSCSPCSAPRSRHLSLIKPYEERERETCLGSNHIRREREREEEREREREWMRKEKREKKSEGEKKCWSWSMIDCLDCLVSMNEEKERQRERERKRERFENTEKIMKLLKTYSGPFSLLSWLLDIVCFLWWAVARPRPGRRSRRSRSTSTWPQTR